MPGKYGSKDAGLLVDGFDLRAAKVKAISHKIEELTEEDHGLGDEAVTHCPTNMSRLMFTQSGAFFDTSADSSHDALVPAASLTPQSVQRIVCAWFAGMAIGAPFEGLEGAYTHVYEVLGQLGLLTKANAEYRVSGQRDRGVILQHLTAKTADWNTKTLGTPVDSAADSTLRVIPITSNSQANPTVVTTPVPHGLATGQVIVIAGVVGSSPDINGQQAVTVISPTTFSVPVDTSAGSGGTGGSFVKANSLNGGVGYLQVKRSTGFTNFVAKIRDSADDTTYADLITFADNVSAPFAERIAVAGTVDRYLSVDGNVTGTGEIEVFVGFARNP